MNKRKSLQSLNFILFCTLTSLNVLAQPTIIEPGDKSINPALLYSGNFTWETKNKDILNLISIKHNNNEITIKTRETKKGLEESIQTIVLNAKNFEPIRESYKDEDRAYSLQYGSKVKGSHTDFETNKKENVDEEITGKYFNPATLSFIISTLPISLDYRVTLSVMRLNSSWKPIYLRYKITDVAEQKSFSCLSGAHDIWKVTVQEKTKQHQLVVFFDKTTRRILRTEQSFDGFHLSDNTYVLADKELDVNPIKARFNVAETMAMLSAGTSSIKGKATTKIANKRITGNKTQNAPKGSLVKLIPNTAYFKEWVDFNLFIGNVSRPVYFDGKLVGGCSYPLPPEVAEATITTEVIDNNGNFEFQNLKPGEYLVFIGFVANKYTHTTRTPTGDYTITSNGDGTGSATQIIDVKHWMSPADILNHQFVKIEKEGETVNVKLK
jgi:SdrD B-like domain